MTLLILTRQTAALVPFHQWLGDAARTACVFTDSERVSEYQGFADVQAFPDYEQSGLVEMMALRLHARRPFERIIATSETDILRAARLRTHLGLPGQDAASAYAFRNKLDMKRRLAGALESVLLPAFSEASESFDIVRFVEHHGFPIIVKPVDGFGSVRTTVIRNDAELSAFLQAGGGQHGLEVEQFIAGAQYHVDGFWHQNEMIFCWPSTYLGNCLSYANGGFTASRMLSPADPLRARLTAAAREVLSILPTPTSTTFHLELFHTAADELYFCEIASRTGGALVNPALERAFGVNLNQLFVQTQAGLPIDVERVQALGRAPQRMIGWGLMAPQDGVFRGSRTAAPALSGLEQFEWHVKPGKRCHGAESAGDRAASFLVEYDGAEQAEERLTATWRWAMENGIWEPHQGAQARCA